MSFRPDEKRDFHGRWTVGGGGHGSHHDDKSQAVLDVLQHSTKERPRTQHEINAAIRNRNGGNSWGPFADKYEAGQTVAALQKQGAIKGKWLPDRRAWGYYTPKPKAAAPPKAGPTKAPARAVAASPKAPTKTAVSATAGHDNFQIAAHGSTQTITGLSLEHAVREHFGPEAEIRDIGEHKYVFKDGRMVARIKRPGEKQFHGPMDYLNR